MKFKDRTSAANLLAKAIKDVLKENKKNNLIRKKETGERNEHESNILVFGIPRGGVLIADIISRKLSCEFDIVISRKLQSPQNKEVAIGAVIEDGTVYLNNDIINQLGISKEYIEKEKLVQIEEIKRRKSLYQDEIVSFDKDRGNGDRVRKGGLTNQDKIKGRTVVLVDDGIATGATIIAAARWIRVYKPKYLLIAAPVATKETRDLLSGEADNVEIITTPPSSRFQSVAQFYQDFKPVEDKQVMEIMQSKIRVNT